jgi:hypothetical protein
MSQRPIPDPRLSGALPRLLVRELRRNAAQGFQPDCPDADRLAAYVEKQLAPAEQRAIVEHLSACQSCRMSVLLAVRAGQTESSPSARWLTPFPARSSSLPWGVVGGVAAGLLVAFVLLWQRPALRQTATPVQQASLQMPAEAVRPELHQSVVPPVAPSRVLRPHAPVPLQPAMAPSSVPVATAINSARPAPSAKPASPIPIRQGFATLAEPSGAAQHPLLPGMEVASTSLNSGGPSSASPQAANSLPMNDGDSFQTAIPMVSSFLGEPLSAKPHASNISSGAGAASPDRMGFAQYMGHDASTSAWRISQGGALEHSSGRGLWIRVPLHAAGRLVSLTVSGAHLWVVSQNGVLYHSADAGQSWHPMHLDLDGHAMQDAIIGIHFTDQRQGELMTRSGARWFTLDGGHFWKPVIAPSLRTGVTTRH